MEMSEILSKLMKQAREAADESNRTGKDLFECFVKKTQLLMGILWQWGKKNDRSTKRT